MVGGGVYIFVGFLVDVVVFIIVEGVGVEVYDDFSVFNVVVVGVVGYYD